MKYHILSIKTFYFLVFLATCSYGQDTPQLYPDTFDDIKIYLSSNCRKVYYEGESPSYEVHIDNISTQEKQYRRFFSFWTARIIQSQGADILKAPRIKVKTGHEGIPFETEKTVPVEYPVPANYKSVHPCVLGFDDFGNIDLTYYLPLSDKDKETYLRKPLFLKPGKYTVEIVCTLFPTEQKIATYYSFEVIRAEGRVKEQLINYLEAMDYTIRNGASPDPTHLTSETATTLWKVLKDDPETPYASDVVRLMAFELDFSMRCVRAYQDDNDVLAFPLFEMIPKLKNFKSIDVGLTYFAWNVHKIKAFQAAGLVSDIPSYVDNYLKRIEHLDPLVSAEFIKASNHYLKIPSLRNYAQERVNASKAQK